MFSGSILAIVCATLITNDVHIFWNDVQTCMGKKSKAGGGTGGDGADDKDRVVR